MKIATSELKGKLLDWSVAKCEGEETHMHHGKLNTRWSNPSYSPTTDWALGGLIIERQEIELLKWATEGWKAKDTNYQFLNTPNERPMFADGYGPTPLIAAMRCFVASKLGDEVEIPNELLPPPDEDGIDEEN